MGRAFRTLKRSTHVTVAVAEGDAKKSSAAKTASRARRTAPATEESK